MTSNYYDLDDILGDDERIMVKLTTDAVGLGYVFDGDFQKDLNKDTKLKLPLWLVSYLKGNNLVMCALPGYLDKKERSQLLAKKDDLDDLPHSASKYFYHVASRMRKLTNRNQEEIASNVMGIFGSRFMSIFDNAQNDSNELVSDVVDRLTPVETKLYQAAANRVKEVAAWKDGTLGFLDSDGNGTITKRRRLI